jgi:metalloprotease
MPKIKFTHARPSQLALALAIAGFTMTACVSNMPALDGKLAATPTAAPAAAAPAPAPKVAEAPKSSAVSEPKADEKKSAEAGGGIAGALGSLAGLAGGTGIGGGAAGKLGAVSDLAQAASITDADVKSSSLQYRTQEDKAAKVAPANNKYAVRLAKLTAKHVNEDGMTLNFKVYLSQQVNANATPDGSIRVYSGLMDMMTDNELLAIIGHEIGHVKLGHRLAKTRAGLMASAARKAAASSNSVAGRIADSELGALGESMFKGQFSQSAETEADDYGLEFLKKHRYDLKGMETGFRKLSRLGGKETGLAQMVASHPDADKRADRARDKAAGK